MVKPMTTERSDHITHPGLTIEVYRLDPVTGRRTPVRPRRSVPPADDPVMNLAFPPCQCPLHREGAR